MQTLDSSKDRESPIICEHGGHVGPEAHAYKACYECDAKLAHQSERWDAKLEFFQQAGIPLMAAAWRAQAILTPRDVAVTVRLLYEELNAEMHHKEQESPDER